jgi:CRP/FNR family cyclic AMP-dependent transcriptional regulator
VGGVNAARTVLSQQKRMDIFMSTITPQLLAEIPLFSNMDKEELSELHSIMTERIYQPGQVCMKEGDLNATFQVIERGEVEIWLNDTDGKKVVLDNLGPGKFFGELSMISGETRSATATSEEQVVTLELSREEFFAFLRRRPDAAIDVLTELGERLKHTDDILRTRISRNPNDAHDQTLSVAQRIADVIADFSGSMPFLFINLTVFVIWIITNIVDSQIFRDPYPFQFLTMAVSLEAIFLSIFVLISQNRQAAKDRIKADLDYQVDVKSEMEMSILAVKIHDIEQKLHHIHSDLLDGKGAKESGHGID